MTNDKGDKNMANLADAFDTMIRKVQDSRKKTREAVIKNLLITRRIQEARQRRRRPLANLIELKQQQGRLLSSRNQLLPINGADQGENEIGVPAADDTLEQFPVINSLKESVMGKKEEMPTIVEEDKDTQKEETPKPQKKKERKVHVLI